EFTIVNGAIETGQYLVAGLFLALLGIVFVGMGVTVLSVVQGKPPETTPETGFHDTISTGLPIVLFLAIVLMLGVYIPPPLESLLRDAARSLEVKALEVK
ncbi:MAG TPA: hypothetical protein VGH74_05165, partial [Planctomycetaceae bacterium]